MKEITSFKKNARTQWHGDFDYETPFCGRLTFQNI